MFIKNMIPMKTVSRILMMIMLTITLIVTWKPYNPKSAYDYRRLLPAPVYDSKVSPTPETLTGSKISTSINNPNHLARRCYKYNNLTSHNVCCPSLDYHDSALIMQCFNSLLTSQPVTSNATRVKVDAIHWVMAGDSHVRNLFDAFMHRLPGEQFIYRLSTYPKGQWHNLSKLQRIPSLQMENQMVKHLTLPIYFTYYWSNLLNNLQHVTKNNLAYTNTPPQLFLVGGILHWIARDRKVFDLNGIEASSKLYKHDLQRLVPHFTQISNTTTVIFKLGDHIVGYPEKLAQRDKNMDVFNRVAFEAFEGSSAVMWDAAIPLSDAYVSHCKRTGVSDYSHWWFCNDHAHIGNVALDGSVEMLLNYMCTATLEPQSTCN